jgi:DNA adenine methylase
MNYSPLRYPGGKNKLSGCVKDILELNNINDPVYVEPYAGGAGVGLNLLLSHYVSEIILNDIDIHLSSFWKLLLSDTDELINKILTTEVTSLEWERQKEIYKSAESYKDLGFAFFFLNRTNRSGILNAGMIGGKAQTGNYKIDARFNKIELIKRIKLIAEYKSKIRIYNLDTIELISQLPIEKANYFTYFDPPYFNKGQRLYTNFYSANDHILLSEKLKRQKYSNWIITYDDTPEIRELYSEYSIENFPIQYSASKSQIGKEVLIHPSYIKIPQSFGARKVG